MAMDWRQGPFADLKGIIMTGAYLQLGQNKHGGGNFIWKALQQESRIK